MTSWAAPPRVDHLLPLDVTLLERSQTGPPDEYGNPTWIETPSSSRAELQQAGTGEGLDGAVQAVTWRLFLPADAPVAGWNVVVVDGRRLELAGDAWRVVNPRTGVAHHVEAIVREVR